MHQVGNSYSNVASISLALSPNRSRPYRPPCEPLPKEDDEDENDSEWTLGGWGSFRLLPEAASKSDPIAVIVETDDKAFGNA